jgi:hypothetical protein
VGVGSPGDAGTIGDRHGDAVEADGRRLARGRAEIDAEDGIHFFAAFIFSRSSASLALASAAACCAALGGLGAVAASATAFSAAALASAARSAGVGPLAPAAAGAAGAAAARAGRAAAARPAAAGAAAGAGASPRETRSRSPASLAPPSRAASNRFSVSTRPFALHLQPRLLLFPLAALERALAAGGIDHLVEEVLLLGRGERRHQRRPLLGHVAEDAAHLVLDAIARVLAVLLLASARSSRAAAITLKVPMPTSSKVAGMVNSR